MMMGYGQFVFSLSTLAYQELQRQTSWRHPSTSVIGARPVRQFLGPGDDSINLSGLLAPEMTGGSAWPLVDGSGVVYGLFVIESLAETHTIFLPDGRARRIEFNLQLARVDDSRTESIGTMAPASAGAGVVSYTA